MPPEPTCVFVCVFVCVVRAYTGNPDLYKTFTLGGPLGIVHKRDNSEIGLCNDIGL